jgi:hypothetical protein
MDDEPWLFGHEHRVALVPNHEGYDCAGASRLLIAYLPFKCARLAAVLGVEDYSKFLFLAGRPRLPVNDWRFEALKKINEPITRDWPIVEMRTFDYRAAFEQLTGLLFDERAYIEEADIHLAILGSKLQTVACWALSTIVRSITVVTSIPLRYYPKAFSEGIGESWVFELTRP